MPLLPVAERELREASRRPGTYWMRFFLALGVFVFWFLLLLMAPSALAIARGKLLFLSLGGVAFLFCFLAGAFLTADSVSEERREGTLGLLFLTPLKGYDVILGKMAATSLHAVYGLFAITPLLAYSWLIGGVTRGEFWRVNLVLLLTLFFSLSAGLFVSGFVRETRQAIVLTLALLLSCGFLYPLLCQLFVQGIGVGPSILPSLLSPPLFFRSALDGQYSAPRGHTRFWATLIVLLLFSGSMLAFIGAYVARTWRDKGEREGAPKRTLAFAKWRFGSEAFRRAREQQLAANPCYWLAARDRLSFLMAAGAVGLALPVFLILAALSPKYPNCLAVAVPVTFFLNQFLRVVIAFEASRRLSEDRHSGALEPLLVAPIEVRQIVSGQAEALRDMFRGSILAAIFMQGVLLFLLIEFNPLVLPGPLRVVLGEVFLGGAVLLALDFRALSWMGMWMGLRSGRHQRAILATLAKVILFPVGVIIFMALLSIGGGLLSLNTLIVLVPLWYGLAGVIKSTFVAQTRAGLAEALRLYWAETRGPSLEQAYAVAPPIDPADAPATS